MGIGFALIIWLVLCMLISACTSVVFGLVTNRYLKQAHRVYRIRAIIAAMSLPPAAVLSAFVGFAGYFVWCEAVRGVDSGFGEGYRIQLGSGYEVAAIDSPEQCFVETPGGEMIGYKFIRIGNNERAIYIETEPNQFLLIDKSTGSIMYSLSRIQLDSNLADLGFHTADLMTFSDFYHRNRWNHADLMAIPMIFGVPLLLSFLVVRYVRKVHKKPSTTGTARGA
jgi:hypothetical protein